MKDEFYFQQLDQQWERDLERRDIARARLRGGAYKPAQCEQCGCIPGSNFAHCDTCYEHETGKAEQRSER